MLRRTKLKYSVAFVLVVVLLFWMSQIRMLSIIQGNAAHTKRTEYYLDGKNVDSGTFFYLILIFFSGRLIFIKSKLAVDFCFKCLTKIFIFIQNF